MKESKDIVSRNDLIEIVNSENWEELWVIFIAHIINRLIYRYGQKKKKDELVDDSKNMLSEVLSLILIDGKRNWNKGKYPTFKDFVLSVIDSYLNNHFNKSKPNVELYPSVEENHQKLNQEKLLEYQEQRKDAFQFLEKEGTTDEELIIFECMVDGILKPQAIIEDLGMSKPEFNNAWRRLKQRLLKLRQKIS